MYKRMLKREKSKLAEGLGLSMIIENYSKYQIYNINLSINKDFDISLLPGLIDNFLSERNISPLFSILFISDKHLQHKSYKLFDQYLSKIIHGMILNSGFNGKSELQLICGRSDQVFREKESVRLITDGGKEDAIEYLFFNSVIPDDLGTDRYKQTYSVFKRLKDLMVENKMSFDKISRTWLYPDNILDWYDELNKARSKFFEEEDLYNKFIPASTGIGLSNNTGSSILASAISVHGDDVKVRPLASPLQCAALDYKSSFSRAVKFTLPDSEKLLISGTASIAPEGDTMHKDNVNKQIEKTMNVVSAILSDNSMSFRDVTRAIAYFPEDSFAENFNEICEKYGLDSDFVAKVNAIVCREDLLFEIELDAVRKKDSDKL